MKTRTKNRMCSGKKKHETEAQAITAVRAARDNGATRMRFYQCKLCHFWHIGHIRKPGGR